MNETKEHIILTSFKLFMQRGYKEVTMSTLVKETGLSKGAFYHYFENKEQLFNATLDNLFFSISPFDKEMIVNPDISFYDYMQMYIDNVEKMSKMIISYIGNEASGIGYYRLMSDVAVYAPEFHKKVLRANENELSFWRKVISNGINSGEIKNDLDLEVLANQFQWLQDGIALNTMFSCNAKDMFVNLDRAFKQLYKCIKN